MNPFQKPEPSTALNTCTCSTHATLLNGFDQFLIYIHECWIKRRHFGQVTMFNNVKIVEPGMLPQLPWKWKLIDRWLSGGDSKGALRCSAATCSPCHESKWSETRDCKPKWKTHEFLEEWGWGDPFPCFVLCHSSTQQHRKPAENPSPTPLGRAPFRSRVCYIMLYTSAPLTRGARYCMSQ